MFASRARLIPHALVLALVLATSTIAHAGEWQHELAPYAWGAGMSGETSIGDVDMSFGDILEDLELASMGVYRATKDRFSVTLDGVYLGLGSTQRGPGGSFRADVDMDQVVLEGVLGYQVVDRLSLLAGLRYTDLQVHTTVTSPLGVAKSSTGEDWLDPVVGATYDVPLSEAWSLLLRADAGGFGIGSDLSWQAVAILRWQVSRSMGLAAAYRYLDTDYDNDDGAKPFAYDLAVSGPAVGVVFTF